MDDGTLLKRHKGITNNVSGCVTNGHVMVVNGTLHAGFEADKLTGYAPLEVNFSNASKSQNNLGISSYWSFGNGSYSITPSANIMASAVYSLAGNYTVSLVARKGTCLDTFVKVITVELPSRLEIPNVFTPNGDQVNDVFLIYGEDIISLKLEIYDRWGNFLFLSNSMEEGWNGVYKNKILDAGAYLWKAEIEGFRKSGKSFKEFHTGIVNLLR